MTGRPSYPWWPADAGYVADFVNDRYMRGGVAVDRATALAFTRSTPKLAQDSSGAWHSFAIDVPALTDHGLLLEPAGTNRVPNAAMAGAAVGVIGAGGTLPTGWTIADFATAEITATGTEAGLPFIELRLQHENSTGGNQYPRLVCAAAIAAGIGEQWTASCFYKKIAGTWPAITGAFLNVEEIGTTIAYATADRPEHLEARARVAATWWTSSPGTIGLDMRALMFNLSPGELLDVTLRIYAPQLAKEAVASSPIITSGAAATRAADAASLSLPGGTYSLALAFDDASTQNVEGQSGSYDLEDSSASGMRLVIAS
ncbi:hypothetical protein [Devosia sp.]|uniref:phage head spike fiber domain-containing protein n=1 Tax=Devosia sp. TaxID=1871048 RepID=UPI00263809BE|nr:hypothetical protein [Devosia sp.]